MHLLPCSHYVSSHFTTNSILTVYFQGEHESASSPLAFSLHLLQKVSGESPYQAKKYCNTSANK